MSDYGYPVLFALFLWWFSTGVIVYLDGLPRTTFRWSMGGATVLLGAALYALAVSSANPTVAGAYVAFSASLIVWGWHEIAFLMGFVTGPRRAACPEGASGWHRVRCATQTILYHELAILVTAAAIIGLTWGAPNQVGTWTFMVLWVMRLSAKLNVFLGVPNLAEDFLPDHLGYLKTYFRRQPMNLLFPISVTTATAAAALLVHQLVTSAAVGFEAVGLTLLTALLALAILEHWLLVLPVSETALWRWALEARQQWRQRSDGRAEVAWLERGMVVPRTVAAPGGAAFRARLSHPWRDEPFGACRSLPTPRRQP